MTTQNTTILIVARTKMQEGRRCLGGLVVSNPRYDNYLRSVRLLNHCGYGKSRYFKEDAPFEIGEHWKIDFSYCDNTTAPHSEDVWVSEYEYDSTEDNLSAFLSSNRSHLLDRGRWFEGSVEELFDPDMETTSTGRGFFYESNVPSISTAFWVPDKDLHRVKRADRADRYRYPSDDLFLSLTDSEHKLSIASLRNLPDTIPEGTICRVSLTQPIRFDNEPDDQEKRSFLQLSDAYLD